MDARDSSVSRRAPAPPRPGHRARMAALATAAATMAGLLLTPDRSAAESSAPGVSITSARVLLRDVMPDCPERACAADLGPAPPPASSRVVPAATIVSALAAAGEHTARAVHPVRVTSAARTVTPAELAELVRPVVERALPPGVTLAGIEPKSGAVLPLLASAGACALPRLPRRAGAVASTALIEFSYDGTLARRIPVLLRLVVSAEAARPSITKGHVVTLVIERRTATVSTQGVALGDADVGQLAQFKVQRTGRVVSARVESDHVARVMEGP